MLGYFEGSPITLTGTKTIYFLPRWLSEEYLHPMVESRVVRYASFWEFCQDRRPRTVCLYRTYALGDILMLLTIARALRRFADHIEEVVIVVELRFHDQLSGLKDLVEGVRFAVTRGIKDYDCDVHYDLNFALEIDHRGNAASDMHRMELYGQALGIEVVPDKS